MSKYPPGYNNYGNYISSASPEPFQSEHPLKQYTTWYKDSKYAFIICVKKNK